MSTQFSEYYIKSLKPREKKYYVREARGFAIVVHPAGKKNPKGTKTFLYIYTFNGERKELKLGRYPELTLGEARTAYHEAYTLHSKGIDPQAPPVAPDAKDDNLTFGHFAKLYLENLEERGISPRWRNTLKCALQKDILPAWQEKFVCTITRRDGINLLSAIAKRGIKVINHHKAASSVLDYALRREYIGANPLYGMDSQDVPALKQKSRERTLSDGEINEIWKAIEQGPGYEETKRALKLVLVTAQRPDEVARMHRREIQVGEGHARCQECRRCGWWTIPNERNKSKREHMVYLTPTALELIGNAEGYIFPSPKDGQPINRNSLSQLVSRDRISKKTGEASRLPFYGLERWTPHDLRRTARTIMSRLRIPSEHSEAVLNHSKKGVEGIYDRHHYQEEKRDALLKWEEELFKIVN